MRAFKVEIEVYANDDATPEEVHEALSLHFEDEMEIMPSREMNVTNIGEVTPIPVDPEMLKE